MSEQESAQNELNPDQRAAYMEQFQRLQLQGASLRQWAVTLLISHMHHPDAAHVVREAEVLCEFVESSKKGLNS